jgi:uncharacterized SAM-binding protein YcdF (DUF218 family)
MIGGLLGLLWVGAAFGLDAYGRRRTASGQFDAIVVAGAQVWRGGRASKALERRTLAAVELFKAGHAPRLVLTGGIGEHPPAQARAAAELARSHGVPESAIVIEERSHTTLENAAFARDLIGPRRVLVVTDAYHVLRCEIIYAHYFPDARLIGVPLGRHAPILDSLREVGALIALSVAVVPRWLFTTPPSAAPH